MHDLLLNRLLLMYLLPTKNSSLFPSYLLHYLADYAYSMSPFSEKKLIVAINLTQVLKCFRNAWLLHYVEEEVPLGGHVCWPVLQLQLLPRNTLTTAKTVWMVELLLLHQCVAAIL